MIFEICAAITVVLLSVLVVFIIQTLLAFQRSLQKINFSCENADLKMMQLNSTFQAISHIGDVCEEKTKNIYKRTLQDKPTDEISQTEDLAELLAAGLKFGVNYFKK